MKSIRSWVSFSAAASLAKAAGDGGGVCLIYLSQKNNRFFTQGGKLFILQKLGGPAYASARETCAEAGPAFVRPEALCGLCEARGGHAYRIGLDKNAPSAEGKSITLQYACPRLAILELLLPAQAVSAWIAPLMGIDLDKHDSDSFSRILAGHLDE